MPKQRRQAELQDKCDCIRMGLVSPDLPKGTPPVKPHDPTRVGARVRRKVAMRKHTHEKTNAERKLTDEQRRNLSRRRKASVQTLTDPSHRFKIRKNAEQLNNGRVPAFSMATRPRGGEDVVLNGAAFNDITNPEEMISREKNACYLMWELRDRAFNTFNTFKPRGCPTDAMAMEMLGQGLAGFWDQAKNWNFA
ncbi:hypothetical protein P692DRAFT_201879532 [Suillus brevipes Sb2]|nr:hypothetical protein P692DRAFT_201879532 [Suillus brevipes Sb2]